jgi:hypothetical protein
MGIRDHPIAPRSPWQNAYVERLIGSIRREGLDHMIVFGEAHLRRILRGYSNTNIFVYRAAVGIWTFEKFLDDEERKHHRWLCHESDWLAKGQAESRKAKPEGTESGGANAK